MAALLWHCRAGQRVSPYLLHSEIPDFFPGPLKEMASPAGKADLIVRDMRDSTVEEMEELRKQGPVVALDDLGPGSGRADVQINLLPMPDSEPAARDRAVPECFLYGYGFLSSLERVGGKPLPREVDFAFYPGDGGDEYISFVLSLLPPKASCVVLGRKGPRLFRKGAFVESPGLKEYAETLLTARVVISHFGITLYEARAAGCEVVSLNPTDYHSRLSDRAPLALNMLNLGTRESIRKEEAAALLKSRLASAREERADPKKVLEDVRSRLDAFCAFLAGSYERYGHSF